MPEFSPLSSRPSLFAQADFGINKEQPINAAVIQQTVPLLICPDEINYEVSTHDYGLSAVSSYGWCTGDWFIWGGYTGLPNRTAFGPNRSYRLSAITDGLSQTLFASEVKTYQPVYICDNVGLSLINNPNNVPPPTADPFSVAPEYNGGCRLYLLGHTEWTDGNSHATGFTTAWPPNMVTIGALTGVDMDLNGINEEDGGPTFAAITSRSYHPQGVQSLLGDGSVHFFLRRSSKARSGALSGRSPTPNGSTPRWHLSAHLRPAFRDRARAARCKSRTAAVSGNECFCLRERGDGYRWKKCRSPEFARLECG